MPTPMTQQQEQHLKDIKQFFVDGADKKYRKGQAEHGGNLWDRDCLKEIVAEAIDLVTYAYVETERNRKLQLVMYNWRGGLITSEAALEQIGGILKS